MSVTERRKLNKYVYDNTHIGAKDYNMVRAFKIAPR